MVSSCTESLCLLPTAIIAPFAEEEAVLVTATEVVQETDREREDGAGLRPRSVQGSSFLPGSSCRQQVQSRGRGCDRVKNLAGELSLQMWDFR